MMHDFWQSEFLLVTDHIKKSWNLLSPNFLVLHFALTGWKETKFRCNRWTFEAQSTFLTRFLWMSKSCDKIEVKVKLKGDGSLQKFVGLNASDRKFFRIRNKLESLLQYISKLRLDVDKLKKIFIRYSISVNFIFTI
jgi:hypothetical protein